MHKLFILYLLLGCSLAVAAETTPAPPPTPLPAGPLRQEAKEAILQLDLGDAEVDFYFTGSWNLSLQAAVGLLIKPGSTIRLLDTFPGITPGLVFTQVPDFTLSLWLMRIFFLDLSYIGSFDDNMFLMGYDNPEGNLLKQLYIGNKDISIPPFRFLEIPETGNASLGAAALLAGAETSHHLLLRYDNNESSGKLFIGSSEVVEYTFEPGQYLRGRYFKLPDTQVENLKLYLEEPAGEISGSDGRKYRQATPDEVVLNSPEGLVSLKQEFPGRVLVYYTKNNLPVGTGHPELGIAALAGEEGAGNLDPDHPVRFFFDMGIHLGEDMAVRRITLQEDCLLLFEPGHFSPFEISASYSLPAGTQLDRWQYNFHVVRKGTRETKTDLPRPVNFLLIGEEDRFTLFRTPVLRDSLWNLYPLPDEMHFLYGPGRISHPAYPSYELLLQVFYPVTRYLLEQDLIPGSVRVIRNNLEETAFTVDYESGELFFDTFIHPLDRIEVYYKRKQSARYNGDLLFAWGHTINLAQAGQLELALGLRWNALPGVYSETPFSRTGAVVTSAGYNLKQEHLSLTAYAGASFTNPDTTGILRLAGMESRETELSLEESTIYPAALPTLPAAAGLNLNNRGRLLYKDYLVSDLLGNTRLESLEWDGYTALPYASGSKPGPYNVAGSSAGKTGRSLVLDFEIDDNPGWVGVQLPLDDADFSGVNALLLSFCPVQVTGSYRVYLQLGETGEDLDGDLSLDAETGNPGAGFVFNDPANGVTLLVGGDTGERFNLRLDSEDLNGNLLLDAENPARLLSLTGPQLEVSTATGWQHFSYPLTTNQQQLLSRVRGLRILIQNTAAGPCSGQLLIDKLQLQGYSCLTTIVGGNQNGESVTVREIPEAFAAIPPAVPLVAAFPEVMDSFHPEGESQRVMEISWQNLESGEAWQLTQYPAAGLELLYYKELSCYLRIPQLTATSSTLLNLSLTDAAGRGIHLQFTPQPAPDWSELICSLEDGSATLNGLPLAVTLQQDQGYSRLSVLKISLSGSPEGLLYIDEIHLQQTQSKIGAGAGLEIGFTLPGPLLSAGPVVILGNLSGEQQAAVSTAGFSALYNSPASDWLWNSRTSLAMDLLYSRLNLNLALHNRQGPLNLSAGHKLTIPAQINWFALSDAFSLSGSQPGESGSAAGPAGITRENSLHLQLNPLNLLDATAGVELKPEILNQHWSVKLQNEITGSVKNTAALNLLASLENEEPLPDQYFTAWLDSFRYLIPRTEDNLLERKSSLTVHPLFGKTPFSVELDTALSVLASEFTLQGRQLHNRISYALSFPLEFDTEQGTKIKIVPGYRRHWQAVTGSPETGDFPADLGELFGNFRDYPCLYNQLPGYELYAAATREAFEDNTGSLAAASYTPEVFISFNKNFGSYLYDLFLPSALDFTLSRSLRKQADNYLYRNHYTLTGRNHAINLFGKLGAYSLFSFYNLDEFATSYTFKLTAGKESGTEAQFSVGNLLSFTTGAESLLSLENSFSINQLLAAENHTSLTFTWFIHPANGINLPLLKLETEKAGYLSHQEQLTAHLKKDETPVTLHPVTVLLSHATSLIWPELGYLTGNLAVGIDLESVTGVAENSWRIVLQGSLEAHLQW